MTCPRCTVHLGVIFQGDASDKTYSHFVLSTLQVKKKKGKKKKENCVILLCLLLLPLVLRVSQSYRFQHSASDCKHSVLSFWGGFNQQARHQWATHSKYVMAWWKVLEMTNTDKKYCMVVSIGWHTCRPTRTRSTHFTGLCKYEKQLNWN